MGCTTSELPAWRRLRAIAPDSIESKVGGKEIVATRKIDGEMQVLCFDGKDAVIINGGGTTRAGLPCVAAAVKALKAAGLKSAMIAAVGSPREVATRESAAPRPKPSPSSEPAPVLDCRIRSAAPVPSNRFGATTPRRVVFSTSPNSRR